ncbi:MAG: alpha/beta hydrolase, partial [Planctomycetaceae bacterium]|nr:alpha/beta hydrolase [Planctomycetaceae bacterium]
EKAEQLKNVPTWAFHGDADDVVSYECSSKMIDAMQTAECSEAKLTTLHGTGHGIMHEVYPKPEIYQWLLKRRK